MKKWAFISVIILALPTWMFWPRFHTSTAIPQADLEITFTIWPLPFLHNVWRREVSIEYRSEDVKARLFDDGGWWRGSSLYQHISGVYVIHEGQNGCFAFTIEPIEFVSVPDGVCTKRNSFERDGDQGSQYYNDLTFLGHFDKTYRDPEGVRLRFLEADEIAEVELPEAL